jgi:type IV pilus assembly protein PilF
MNRAPWIACVALALAACAAPEEDRREPPISDTGTLVGEVSEPRNRAKIRTELASLYFQRGSHAIALEELRTAIGADPTYALAHGMLGLVYMELRENKLAQASFERALQLAPNDSDINHNYGWFLCHTGREADATRYFLHAVRNPLYPTPWRSLAAAGTCSLRKDRLKEAEEFFQHALKLEPDDTVSLLQLGEVRYRQGNLEEARRLVGRFNKLVDPTSESLWLALRVERKLGERNAESSFAAQLRRRFPASREYRLMQRGEFD